LTFEGQKLSHNFDFQRELANFSVGNTNIKLLFDLNHQETY